MKNVFTSEKIILGAGLFLFAISTIAWQTSSATKNGSTAESKIFHSRDTTVPKYDPVPQDISGVVDMDKILKGLDVQMLKINKQLDSLQLQLKGLNSALIKKLDNTMTDIDMQKINQEMQLALQKIDLNQLTIDSKKAIEQTETQLKHFNMQKMQAEIKKMRQQINQDNIYEQINAENIKEQVKGALQNANEQIKKAATELQELKIFIAELEKDGLIDRKKGFILEWKTSGELYINNVRQPKHVADKYSKYYHRDGYKVKMGAEGNFAHPDSI